MIRTDIRGGPELRYVAGKLRKAAARDLTVRLRKAQRDAFRPLETDIKREAFVTLPSGYGPIMSRAVKVTLLTRSGVAWAARVYARGQREDRDVRAVNAGMLRHPLFGHRKRWYLTRVRRGFVDRPVERLLNRALDECTKAAEITLREIAST